MTQTESRPQIIEPVKEATRSSNVDRKTVSHKSSQQKGGEAQRLPSFVKLKSKDLTLSSQLKKQLRGMARGQRVSVIVALKDSNGTPTFARGVVTNNTNGNGFFLSIKKVNIAGEGRDGGLGKQPDLTLNARVRVNSTGAAPSKFKFHIIGIPNE